MEELQGVAAVSVDYATRTATCKVDAETFDKNAAVDALTAASYKDSVIQ